MIDMSSSKRMIQHYSEIFLIRAFGSYNIRQETCLTTSLATHVEYMIHPLPPVCQPCQQVSILEMNASDVIPATIIRTSRFKLHFNLVVDVVKYPQGHCSEA